MYEVIQRVYDTILRIQVNLVGKLRRNVQIHFYTQQDTATGQLTEADMLVISTVICPVFVQMERITLVWTKF